VTSFVIVDPATASARREEHPSLRAALGSVGLSVEGSDAGLLRPGLGYAIGSWALVGDPRTYYAIEGKLLNGPVVLFGRTADGRTDGAPKPTRLKVTWFAGVADVEAAIAKGDVVRPVRTFDGEVTWAWDGRTMDPEEARASAASANARAIERRTR
jgi:hypothetical protein